MRDAIIIGGGPAGCFAALLLARGGWSIKLIEQHRFPRDKVCGECLSALGIEVLERHDLLQPLLALNPTRLTRANLYAGDGSSASVDLPRPMFGLSRKVLDSFLLDQARSAGVSIYQPCRCEAIKSSQDLATVTARDLTSNTVQSMQVSHVIVADGKSALPIHAPPATADLGIKCHWTGVNAPPDAIELFGFDGCYGGLAPIENDRWNMALAVPTARVRRRRGDLDALFGELVAENPVMRRRLARATRRTEWLASPLPRFGVIADWPERVIPVGNAAAAIEPIGGEGMGLAFRSAELAATALLAGDGAPIDPRALRDEFQKLWRVPRFLCRAGAILASYQTIASTSFAMLQNQDSLSRQLLCAMGK